MDFKAILEDIICGHIELHYNDEVYDFRKSEFKEDGNGSIDFTFEVVMYNDWLDSKKLYSVRGYIMNDVIRIIGRTFRADIA